MKLFSKDSLNNYLKWKKAEIQNEILAINEIPANPEEFIYKLLTKHIVNPIELTEITQGEPLANRDIIIINFFINFTGDGFLLHLQPSHAILPYGLPNLKYLISDLWVEIEYKISNHVNFVELEKRQMLRYNHQLRDYIFQNTSNQKLEIEPFNNGLKNFMNGILTQAMANLKQKEQNLIAFGGKSKQAMQISSNKEEQEKYFKILWEFEDLTSKEHKIQAFIDTYSILSKAFKEYIIVKSERLTVGWEGLARGLSNQSFIYPEIKAQITVNFISDLLKCLKEIPEYYPHLKQKISLFKKCVLEKYDIKWQIEEIVEDVSKLKPLTKTHIRNKCKTLIMEKIPEYLKQEKFKTGGFKSELCNEIKEHFQSKAFTNNIFNEKWSEVTNENPQYKFLAKRGRRYEKEAEE